MDRSAITVAKQLDLARLVDTMVLAFARDPVMRWAQPEPHRYLIFVTLADKVTIHDAFPDRRFKP